MLPISFNLHFPQQENKHESLCLREALHYGLTYKQQSKYFSCSPRLALLPSCNKNLILNHWNTLPFPLLECFSLGEVMTSEWVREAPECETKEEYSKTTDAVNTVWSEQQKAQPSTIIISVHRSRLNAFLGVWLTLVLITALTFGVNKWNSMEVKHICFHLQFFICFFLSLF